MKRNSLIIQNQKGVFGIGFVILAFMTVALLVQTTGFFRTFQKSLKSSKASTNIEGLMGQIQKILNDKDNCKATTEGLRIGTSELQDNTGTKVGDLAFRIVDNLGNKVVFNALYTGDTRIVSLRSLDPENLPQNLIDKYGLPQAPSNNGWNILLEVQFQKTDNQRTVMGGNLITRHIPVTVNNFVHLVDLMAEEGNLADMQAACYDPADPNREYNVLADVKTITVKDYDQDPVEEKVMLIGKCYSAQLDQVVQYCP